MSNSPAPTTSTTSISTTSTAACGWSTSRPRSPADEPWFNQTLTTVNESVVRLGVIEGDFHWHHHDDQDEFFLVLEGRLLIDLEDRETVTLEPHQGYTVPRGVEHRTRAPVRTAILMVESAGVGRPGD